MLTAQKQKLRLKREMAEEKPSMWIGKKGVTDELVREALTQLERTQTTKIKIQKTALMGSRVEDLAMEIATKTSSDLIDIRGRSLILYRVKTKCESCNGR